MDFFSHPPGYECRFYCRFAQGISVCRMRTWPSLNRLLVVVTELKDNPGPSVTNSAAAIFKAVLDKFQIDRDDLVLVEHYGPESYALGAEKEDRFARVLIDENGNAAWQHVTEQQMVRMLEGSLDDL